MVNKGGYFEKWNNKRDRWKWRLRLTFLQYMRWNHCKPVVVSLVTRDVVGVEY